MRLDKEKPDYENVEDHRGDSGGGGFRFPGGGGGGRFNIPMGGRGGGFSIKTIIILAIVYFLLKAVFGIDLLQMINGGGLPDTGGGTSTEMTLPGDNTNVTDAGGSGGSGTASDVTADAGKEFVARVLGSTRRVWESTFASMGQQYQPPKLYLFNGFVQSACGNAQASMGPFYCPGDRKVYIDLSFYQDLKTKLGAPGDFAQAYVIAHEVGHHVQNLLGTAGKVQQARMRASEEDSNALSVRMELQADCFAGIWAKKADATAQILEEGDIEEALNAAAQIGDDRLQKKSQGYVVPESFTHGTSAQRVKWFKTGYGSADIGTCDTFGADNL